MKQVFKYIRGFYTKEFKLVYLLLIMAMLAVLIYLNYWHGLEKKWAGGGSRWSNFAGSYCIYFIPFSIAFFLQPVFYKNCTYFRSRWFWTILLLAPAFFAFRVNFDFHKKWVLANFADLGPAFFLVCISYVVRVFVVLLPVYVIWRIKDKHNQPFYGSKALDSLRPYLLMLLFMLPLIALASTQRDFLQVYPKAKLVSSIPLSGWIEKARYLIFEASYGFDFVSIEFFFRGFLILSLLKICGEHCILPIACFYCSIHFGKPLGEAVSSFFGGTLLGIVSYNSRSIWGGLLVHLGIAWMMEAGGFIGNLLIK